MTFDMAYVGNLTRSGLNKIDLETIQHMVMVPGDPRDMVDASEIAAARALLANIERGKVALSGVAKEEVVPKLRNIVSAKVFESDTSFWSYIREFTYFNSDYLMVDLEGVTYIQPSCTGLDERYFFPYKDITGVRALPGWLYTDKVIISTRLDLNNMNYNAVEFHAEDATTAMGIEDLITLRLRKYNRSHDSKGNPIRICIEGTKTMLGSDGVSYAVYTSPTCNATMTIAPVAAQSALYSVMPTYTPKTLK